MLFYNNHHKNNYLFSDKLLDNKIKTTACLNTLIRKKTNVHHFA